MNNRSSVDILIDNKQPQTWIEWLARFGWRGQGQFAIAVNDTRGWPSDAQLDAFLAAGYSRRSVLEVILGTALKVLSNYTNHVAETDLDDAFKANAWDILRPTAAE